VVHLCEVFDVDPADLNIDLGDLGTSATQRRRLLPRRRPPRARRFSNLLDRLLDTGVVVEGDADLGMAQLNLIHAKLRLVLTSKPLVAPFGKEYGHAVSRRDIAVAMAFYLYGIFPAPGPQDLSITGLDKQEVRSHHLDQFTFLYSEACQSRYLASRKNLLGHEKVLETAMQHGHHTLLPLQFGLTVERLEPGSELTWSDPHAEGLTQLFQRLDGRREVSVKVLWDATTELEMLMQENDDLRARRDQLEGKQLSMDEVIRIGQQIEAALEERKEAIIQQFRDALQPLSEDVIENDPMTDCDDLQRRVPDSLEQ
jgi:hypothetical protein